MNERRSVRLRRRARQPLRSVDVVLLVAAVASWVVWMAGIRPIEVVALVGVWILCWVWWRRRRGNALVAAFCLGALLAMLWGPRWHGAFELARDCMTDRATSQLNEAPIDFGRFDADRRGAGRCGPVRYQASVTAQGFSAEPDSFDGGSRDVLTAVWFVGAGPPVLDLFGGGAYVYSPDGAPGCADRAIGDTHGCDHVSLGEGWYHVVYDSNIN